MSTPAEYLKILGRAHHAVLLSVSQIQSVVRSYSSARALLGGLGEQLLAFLGVEDEEFFRSLRDLLSEDRPALKMLEFLELDLKDLKIKYLVFYDRYTNIPTGNEDRIFLRDYREFSAAIVARVNLESEYLFPLLQRVAAKD